MSETPADAPEPSDVVIPLTPADPEAEAALPENLSPPEASGTTTVAPEPNSADPESATAAPETAGRPKRPVRLGAGQLSALMSAATQLSAANQRPGVIGAIRKARESLPGDPAFGDPLSVSGPGGPRAVARAADRLTGDTPSAAREIGLGALQVWQAMLERTGRGRGTRPITVLFTDLVAFSRWSLTAGDETTLILLREVAKAIEPPIVERGGQVVKRMGDGVMAVFASPDRAVDAVVTARRNLARVRVQGYRPQMRAGLHTGTPREIGGDWLGVDVTVAARVMEAGGNGNTMLSSATLEALQPETLERLGLAVKPYRRSIFAAPLSGVPEDLRIYRLDGTHEDR
ncbi:adenylate/guanylate cyclase domain-containing protein [Nocardia aurantia]|uniref:adenylate/guanylate cyclase domain-containing protein n=1 Tax=Nocardia aurantia TaxID=2585199 RepID=UPI003873B0A9